MFVTGSAYKSNYAGKEGLLAAAASEGLDHLLTPADIKEGKSAEEIWDTFKTVFRHVEDGDLISFDITHSFRSIPVMGLACLQYARTLRNVTLEGVYYGAFEARDAEANTPPIFDLTPFLQLMEWSQAVNEFVKFGQCGALHQQVRSGTLGRKDKQDNLLRTLAGDLKRTGSDIAGCCGKSIFLDPPWEKIPGHIKKLRRQGEPLLSAFEPLLDKIEEKVANLGIEAIGAGQEVRRGLGVVRWCLQHDMVQQAYSVLHETIITHVCQLAGMDFREDNNRVLASQCPKIMELPEKEWKEPAASRKDCVARVRQCVRPELLQLLGDFSGWRNTVMHCKLGSDKDFITLKKKVAGTFDRFLGCLESGMEVRRASSATSRGDVES